jgi:hypothetical protein
MKLASTLPLVLALFASPAFANPSLETVLSKHFDAQGGLARLKAVSSVSSVSTDTFEGKTSTYASQRMRPNLWRTEVTEGTAVTVKGFDGQNGWVQKDGAVEMMAAEKSAMMKAKSHFDDPLLDAAARGWTVELAGTETVDGAPAHVLVMKNDSGDTQRRYIDAKSYLEVKRVSTFTYDGKAMEKTARFSGFKTFNGITVATKTEYSRDGKSGSYVLTKLEFDAPLKATAFAPPRASGAPTLRAASTK